MRNIRGEKTIKHRSLYSQSAEEKIHWSPPYGQIHIFDCNTFKKSSLKNNITAILRSMETCGSLLWLHCSMLWLLDYGDSERASRPWPLSNDPNILDVRILMCLCTCRELWNLYLHKRRMITGKTSLYEINQWLLRPPKHHSA